MPETYDGTYSFPGQYAYLVRNGSPDAILQFDDPYTGAFNQGAADATCTELQRYHHDGDRAHLPGLIKTVDVNGRPSPVLFIFE